MDWYVVLVKYKRRRRRQINRKGKTKIKRQGKRQIKGKLKINKQ
jgi:hypothetical protein